MSDELIGLAERVEAATSNSWDLDREIFKACHLPDTWFGSKVISWFGDGPFGCNTEDGIRHLDCINAPNYTASLDAAMSLVPEGFASSVEWSPQFPGHAWLYPPDNDSSVSFEGRSGTPALALTAASLRAIASSGGK